MIYHMIAFSIGVIMDWIIGDPYSLPHPIRLIGNFIHHLDLLFLGDKEKKSSQKQFFLGVLTVIIVTLSTLIITLFVTLIFYKINRYLGIVFEAILTCYCLAAKSLTVESNKVKACLFREDIPNARYAVSMIVGRDTNELNGEQITKACIETVAENTSDGVIAPLFYAFLFGPIGGMVYKSINTLDSMIGYQNDRYEYFGKAAARLDDAAGFIPSRLGALAMILAALLSKKFDGKKAIIIFKRDRFKSKSPNSAQTESVCAGALGLKLLGPASYFGKLVNKPYIGDDTKSAQTSDITKANQLMYMTEIILFVLFLFIGSILIYLNYLAQ